MKIRIKGNSVRFRLTQSEVKTLTETGFIKEETTFDTTVFCYQIKSTLEQKEMHASFTDGKLTLYVPEEKLKNWHSNSIVGFSQQQVLSSGNILSLLLEKDFTCLDNTLEDQSDNYPNPKNST